MIGGLELRSGSAPAPDAMRRALAAHSCAGECSAVWNLLAPQTFGARRAEQQPRRLCSPKLSQLSARSGFEIERNP